MTKLEFDIVIVGAGPAGLAAGIQAASRGCSHLILERGELANTIHRYQRHKLVMAEPPALPLQPGLDMQFKEGTREQILEHWAANAAAAGINLERGSGCEVLSAERDGDRFVLRLRDGRTLSCTSLVLALGVQGNLRTFEVPGAGLPHLTYQLDDAAEQVDKRVVVVGTGDAGIENALALTEYAESVAIVNRGGEFDRAKTRNRALIEAAIKNNQMTHYSHCDVDHFEPNAIVLRAVSGAELRVECDLVVGRLGAIPPRKFLERLGIQFPSPDPMAVPEVSESYESNVPGLYLVGALVGYPLIKNCMNQGFEVVERILGKPVVPADEPLLQERLRWISTDTGVAIEAVRNGMEIFRGLTTVQLRELLVASTVFRLSSRRRGERLPTKGDVIFQRNDFSDAFFSILKGSVEVFVPVVETETSADRRDAPRERRIVLSAGQFFGEGSLLSGRRRIGTVRALEECLLIETPRLTMSKLLKQVPDVRRALDTTFIERGLANYVATPDGGTLVPDDAIRNLAARAVVEMFAQGQVLWQEGAPADGFHYIRRGAVTISRDLGGKELVLNYVQAGNYLGERAIVSPDGKRTATVRAAVLTETVRLPAAVITEFLAAYPSMHRRLEEVDLGYEATDAAHMLERHGSDLLSFLMSKGAGEATDLLLIDESLCVRCDNCEQACAATHAGFSRLDREAGPTFGTIHIPSACRHCENPKCMTDCPPDAIRRRPDGEVVILDNCIGCGNCAANCPYDVIRMAHVSELRETSLLGRLIPSLGTRATTGEDKKLAVKCDLCTNLRPSWSDRPRAACVASCPTGAIVRVNPRKYVDEILDSRAVEP